jgi:hypothetical protein
MKALYIGRIFYFSSVYEYIAAPYPAFADPYTALAAPRFSFSSIAKLHTLSSTYMFWNSCYQLANVSLDSGFTYEGFGNL